MAGLCDWIAVAPALSAVSAGAVLTLREPVAKWAAHGIDHGGGDCFTPLVLGPSGVPLGIRRQRRIYDAI